MKLVLLSGGSGKRLWPLSNDSRSKQFLPVLTNDNGDKESMVQRVWRQLRSVNLSDSSVIATSSAQVDMIRNQLGDVPLVVEPNRRDTFPAIALAATYLYSIEGCGINEAIGVLPVDPYVENGFFNKVNELEVILKKSDADLALIGVSPTYPSEKYGYIVPMENQEGNSDSILEVDHFAEKPNEDVAKGLLKRGALWNSGVFAFKLEYIINLLIEKKLPIQYDELLKKYSELPKISFDYEVVEKAKKIAAIPYSGYWKDLGTWNTLTEEMAQKTTGYGLVSDDCKNTHVINELDIPVSVLGLSNIVVASSPDGILVSDKNASPRVKELVNRIEQRPMYVERLWGSYKVLDYYKTKDGKEVLTRKINLKEGKNLSYQTHSKRSEVWTILCGEGEMVLNEELTKVKAGDIIKVSPRVRHALKAQKELEFIEVQTGTEILEDDVDRLCLLWDEIKIYSYAT